MQVVDNRAFSVMFAVLFILAKPVYLCARVAQIGTVASLTQSVASRQGARSASHRVMQA